MQLFVKYTNGTTGIFECNPTDTILTLKSYVNDKEGVPIDLQMLTHNGHVLDNNFKTFDELKIREHNTIHVNLRVFSKCPQIYNTNN